MTTPSTSAAPSGTVRAVVRTLWRAVRTNAWAAYMGGLLSALHVHCWQWQFYAAMLPMCILVSLRPNAPGQARAGSPSPEAGCSVPAAIAEAVAAVYFDDSADYRRALLNVVRHLDAAAYDMTLIDTAKAYRRYCEPNNDLSGRR